MFRACTVFFITSRLSFSTTCSLNSCFISLLKEEEVCLEFGLEDKNNPWKFEKLSKTCLTNRVLNTKFQENSSNAVRILSIDFDR